MERETDQFVEAFNLGDFDGIRRLLDDALVAHITSPEGEDVEMHGADAYVESLRAMLTSAPTDYHVGLTQKPVAVGEDRILLMLEIRASRGRKSLHNFSAQLFRFDGPLICEIQMTDAKPRESSEFWA